MMSLFFEGATDLFFDQLAVVSFGAYTDTVPVAVVHGTTVDAAPGSSLPPVPADAFSVRVKRADWKCTRPPEFAVSVDTPLYGRLTVQTVTEELGCWVLSCTRDERAREGE